MTDDTTRSPGKCVDEDAGMDLQRAYEFARQVAGLGDAVGEQLGSLIAGEFDEEHVTEGALCYIEDRMRGYSDELDEMIDECRESKSKESDIEGI